jgi:hypothetical protein
MYRYRRPPDPELETGTAAENRRASSWFGWAHEPGEVLARFIERLDLVHAYKCCSRVRSSMRKPGLPEFGVPVP